MAVTISPGRAPCGGCPAGSIERQATTADGRAEFDLGIQRQQRRRTVGGRRGVAEIARERAAVLDLDAADLPGGLAQSVEGGRQRRRDHVAPGGERADPYAFRGRPDPAQRVEAGQIEDRPRRGLEPGLTRGRGRIEVGRASQRCQAIERIGRRLGSVGGQRGQRFVEGARTQEGFDAISHGGREDMARSRPCP